MSLAEDVWQAVKGAIPRSRHSEVARDIVQLFESAGEADPIYGRGTLYEAAGLDDQPEDDEEVEEL